MRFMFVLLASFYIWKSLASLSIKNSVSSYRQQISQGLTIRRKKIWIIKYGRLNESVIFYIHFSILVEIIITKTTCFLEVFSNMEVWKCSGCFQTKLKDSFGHMISKQMRFLKKTISNFKKWYRTIFDFLTNMLFEEYKT